MKESHWLTTSARILGRDVTRLGLLAFVRLLPLVVALAGGCGDPQTVAAKSISGAQQTLIGLKTGLVDYDKAHQDAIIDGAVNREDALKKLAAYRNVRAKIATGLLAAQQLLVTAESALLLVQAGIADISTIGGPVANLLAAVTKLVLDFATLQAPGATPPPPTTGSILHVAPPIALAGDLLRLALPAPLAIIGDVLYSGGVR